MKLEEYLQGLTRCPDERIRLPSGEEVHRLTAEFGINYEFPILLKSDIEKVVEFITKRDFKITDSKNDLYILDSEEGLRILAHYKHFKYFTTADNKSGWYDASDEEEFHHTKQNRDYNLAVRLLGNEEDSDKEIIIGNGIIQIGRFAIANNLFLCFPRSTGLRTPEDYSRIIYFPDSDENMVKEALRELKKSTKIS